MPTRTCIQGAATIATLDCGQTTQGLVVTDEFVFALTAGHLYAVVPGIAFTK